MIFGRIYAIRTHQSSDIYIGSTTQILCKRMADHRGDYKLYLNKKFSYLSSFEILQYNDAYIELLFEGEFSSRNDLDRKEGEFQRSMECVNKNIAGRTKKEHYKDNKEKISVKGKQYREKNPEIIKERAKKYYEENKPKILEYHTQYYEKNQEKVIEKSKNYREEHLDQIHARRQQTYKCECGSISCIENKARHERSKKHKAFILLSESAAKNFVEVHSSLNQSEENCEALK